LQIQLQVRVCEKNFDLFLILLLNCILVETIRSALVLGSGPGDAFHMSRRSTSMDSTIKTNHQGMK
jgi:hypothetical protein